jgi:hypothetical protein
VGRRGPAVTDHADGIGRLVCHRCFLKSRFFT